MLIDLAEKTKQRITAQQHKLLLKWLAYSFTGLLTLSCSCQSKRGPKLTECIQAQAIELTASSTDIIQLADQPAEAVDFRIWQVAAAERTTAPSGAYALDISGDGQFETMVSSPEFKVTFTQTRLYPVQVSAVSCEGQILTARLNVNVRIHPRPQLTVVFSPGAGTPWRVGDAMSAQFFMQAAREAQPVVLAWSWGDGVTGQVSIADLAVTASVTASHAFSVPGVFSFVASLTDAFGVSVSVDTTLLASVAIEQLQDIYFGFLSKGIAVSGASGTSLSQANVTAVVALGSEGLSTVQLLHGLKSVQSRFKPAFAFTTPPALAVALDRIRQIAYAAAGEFGFYAVDITNPQAPKLLMPSPLLPAGAPLPFFQQLWLCNQGRWLFLKNLNGSIYAMTLDDNVLAYVRQFAQPVSNPWSELRSSPTPGSNVFELYHPNAVDIACYADRWLFIAENDTVWLYDLADFFAAPQAARLVDAAVVPQPANMPHFKLVDIELAAHALPSAVTLTVAAEQNGWLEYGVDTLQNPPQLSLRKHFLIRQYALFSEGGQYFYDSIESIFLHGKKLFVFIRSADGFENTYVFNLAEWPSPITRELIYPIDQRCTANVLAGQFGTAFPDIKKCFAAMPFRSVYTSSVTNIVWLAEVSHLRPLDAVALSAGTRWDLPPVIDSTTLFADGIWLSASGAQYFYDFNSLLTATSLLTQPPPTTVAIFNLRPKTLLASAALGTGIAVDTNAIYWLEVNQRTFDMVASQNIYGGIQVSSFLPQQNAVAIVRGYDQRVELWQLAGSQANLLFNSTQDGFVSITACADRFVAWRPSASFDKRHFWQFTTTTQQMLLEEALTPQTFIGCQGSQLFVIAVDDAGQMRLTKHMLADGILSYAVAQALVPVRRKANFNAVAIAANNDLIGLLFQGIDGGLLLYRQAGGTITFIGGEFTRDVADLASLSLFKYLGSDYYMGLSRAQPHGKVILRRIVE